MLNDEYFQFFIECIFILLFLWGLWIYINYFFPDFRITSEMSKEQIKKHRKRFLALYFLGVTTAIFWSKAIYKLIFQYLLVP